MYLEQFGAVELLFLLLLCMIHRSMVVVCHGQVPEQINGAGCWHRKLLNPLSSLHPKKALSISAGHSLSSWVIWCTARRSTLNNVSLSSLYEEKRFLAGLAINHL